MDEEEVEDSKEGLEYLDMSMETIYDRETFGGNCRN